MRHGNSLNPKIGNQNISVILTVPILVNLYRENLEKLTKFPFLTTSLYGGCW